LSQPVDLYKGFILGEKEKEKEKEKNRHILREKKTEMWLYLDNEFLLVARTRQVYYLKIYFTV
jgi:hypothetical protein